MAEKIQKFPHRMPEFVLLSITVWNHLRIVSAPIKNPFPMPHYFAPLLKEK